MAVKPPFMAALTIFPTKSARLFVYAFGNGCAVRALLSFDTIFLLVICAKPLGRSFRQDGRNRAWIESKHLTHSEAWNASLPCLRVQPVPGEPQALRQKGQPHEFLIILRFHTESIHPQSHAYGAIWGSLVVH